MPDADAFERFYRESLVRIVRACALITLDRSVAENVAAEAFVRLWSRWGSIDSDDHAGGFVFKTAMWLSVRELRRRRRRAERPQHVGDSVDRALLRNDLAAAIEKLSLRQRQAIVLRDWAGFETSEVARMLAMRESTVRVHLSRARQLLRASLQVEEGSQR